jgi:hypothetical protein
VNLTLDRNAEINISAKITVKVDPEPVPEGCAVLRASFDGFAVTSTGGHMAYTLPDDKRVKLKISYKDANGNAARIDGPVVWDSSDAAIAAVVPTEPPAADNSEVWLTPGEAGGAIGQAQITARADADLGAGVAELITTLDVEVVGGQAVAGTIEPVGEFEPLP